MEPLRLDGSLFTNDKSAFGRFAYLTCYGITHITYDEEIGFDNVISGMNVDPFQTLLSWTTQHTNRGGLLIEMIWVKHLRSKLVVRRHTEKIVVGVIGISHPVGVFEVQAVINWEMQFG